MICPITVAEGNTSYFDENGVIYSTGKKLLLYAGAVEGAFQIPDGVEEIGAAAFSGAKLSDVTIPGSVTDIDVRHSSTAGNCRASRSPAAFRVWEINCSATATIWLRPPSEMVSV